MNTQDKIFLGPSEARFMKLPPISQLVDTLPPKVFKFVANESMMGMDYFLEYAEPFKEPSKLYGNLPKQVDRIIHSYKQQTKNLGVLLHGVSGTGKSTLAKCIANTVLQSLELPVIIVTGQSIKHLEYLISNLKQPDMFLVDEFEKMFEDKDDQSYLLTLLDGLYSNNHLFVLTANDASKINTYFFNRPSRIRYAIEYKSLGLDVCEEILRENFEPQYVEDLLGKLATVNNLSFDVLQEIMTEAKHFPDLPVHEVFDGFNLSRLNLNLSYCPITVKAGDKDLTDILKTVFKKFSSKADKLGVKSTMHSDVSLDDVYNHFYSEGDSTLFITRLTFLDEEDTIYFSPDRTTVKNISPTTIELSVEMGDKYASYFADKLTYLLSNSTPDSVNISKVRNELRKELTKADFRNITISIPRAYCVYDY